MQHDEVIWQVVNHSFCSFKVKTQTQNFCRNRYNVTGLCNRSSCPLANSRYSTIVEDEGQCYLYIKTIERAHSPKNLWEKIKLPRNYAKALQRIDKELEYFPKFLKHKAKQRLTKIHQYLIRMRRLELKVRPQLVGIKKKVERREKTRERKALSAAHLEQSIKQELIERLQAGTYGDIYNFPARQYDEVLDSVAVHEDEGEEEEEEEEEDESEREFVDEYVEDYDEFVEGNSDLDLEDFEAWDNSTSNDNEDRQAADSRRKKRRKNVQVEYEHELEEEIMPAS